MQQVKVIFPNSTKFYTYSAPSEWVVSVGDKLVVDTPRSGLTVVTVVKVSPEVIGDKRCVVSQVDMKGHLERIRIEEEEFRLKTEMKARAEEIEVVSKYARMAKGDATMARLLHRFKQVRRKS